MSSDDSLESRVCSTGNEPPRLPTATHDNINLKAALRHQIYDSLGKKWRLGDVFAFQAQLQHNRSRQSSDNDIILLKDQPEAESSNANPRLLIIFIRHFFCGNCQEYLLRLAAHPSFSVKSLASRNLSLVIIGCGAPTIIPSYRALTGLPSTWQLYSDPSCELYRLLGMQRTYSLGDRGPRYIRRSLTGNALRSIAQGIRRIPEGDAHSAGGWDVNGGEFLFEISREGYTGMRKTPGSWNLTWCHRMRNSRDHTEIEDLMAAIGLADNPNSVPDLLSKPKLHARTQSSPRILEDDSLLNEKLDATPLNKRKSGLRRSVSTLWANRRSSLGRRLSFRVS
ncbi:hypothetical protein PMZ80_010788 [Knufia obscura]|uniref:Uncharacterized protein n=2 Tax=Knufia TaxID=430999 RepID=A0AAN8F1Z2_9EURO|nr:hypothetical protein PMZ80_010788 [Knufia obscura]KAK5949826.1 hypothetical protein OHC33_009215 [Knufia fluminis]